jgi:hypothetical protein
MVNRREISSLPNYPPMISSLKKALTVFSLISPLASCNYCEGDGCFTREMLDVWTRFRNDQHFDAEGMWERMDACFQRKSTDEISLWNVSDGYWSGFIEYGIAGGSQDGTDPWDGPIGIWMENDPTPMVSPNDVDMFPALPPGASDIIVYEPCNTVSNTAFIRTMLSVCEHEEKYEWTLEPETVTGLIQAIALMGPGSFFFHASGTSLGGSADNNGIHLLALISHQGLLQSIPYDPVLHDLSETPVTYTGREAAAIASHFISNDPVDDWEERFRVLAIKQ